MLQDLTLEGGGLGAGLPFTGEETQEGSRAPGPAAGLHREVQAKGKGCRAWLFSQPLISQNHSDFN